MPCALRGVLIQRPFSIRTSLHLWSATRLGYCRSSRIWRVTRASLHRLGENCVSLHGSLYQRVFTTPHPQTNVRMRGPRRGSVQVMGHLRCPSSQYVRLTYTVDCMNRGGIGLWSESKSPIPDMGSHRRKWCSRSCFARPFFFFFLVCCTDLFFVHIRV